MADRPARLQILPVDVELLRDAPPPEEVARELVARLSALPYVVDVQWSPEVVIEEEELGKDRFLHGRVTMLPLEQLPEDDPELKAYYDCFKLPGIVGPNGVAPLTAKQQAGHAVEEFDRIDQEKRIRAALAEDEQLQTSFFEANREWFTQQAFVQKPPLSPLEIELSVSLNMQWEDLDQAAYRESQRGGLEVRVRPRPCGRASLGSHDGLQRDLSPESRLRRAWRAVAILMTTWTRRLSMKVLAKAAHATGSKSSWTTGSLSSSTPSSNR